MYSYRSSLSTVMLLFPCSCCQWTGGCSPEHPTSLSAPGCPEAHANLQKLTEIGKRGGSAEVYGWYAGRRASIPACPSFPERLSSGRVLSVQIRNTLESGASQVECRIHNSCDRSSSLGSASLDHEFSTERSGNNVARRYRQGAQHPGARGKTNESAQPGIDATGGPNHWIGRRQGQGQAYGYSEGVARRRHVVHSL